MDTPSLRIGHLLNNVTNDLRRSADRVFEGTGISDMQWAILSETSRSAKSHEPTITIAVVADRIGRDPDAVAREISRLEERKLVRVDGEGTALTRFVTLTTRAERLLPALNVAMAALAEQATSGLTNDDLIALEELLQIISDNLS